MSELSGEVVASGTNSEGVDYRIKHVDDLPDDHEYVTMCRYENRPEVAVHPYRNWFDDYHNGSTLTTEEFADGWTIIARISDKDLAVGIAKDTTKDHVRGDWGHSLSNVLVRYALESDINEFFKND